MSGSTWRETTWSIAWGLVSVKHISMHGCTHAFLIHDVSVTLNEHHDENGYENDFCGNNSTLKQTTMTTLFSVKHHKVKNKQI